LDPNCAMVWWGVALVLGPNYNMAMVPEAVAPAYEAIQQALKLAPRVSEKEQAYIRALAKRYSAGVLKDRSSLDKAYASEMQKLAQSYPDDPDASALYAEASMDLHPWDLYTRNGDPKEWTPALVDLIEKGMYRWPEHPGFHHFYIHAVEASRNPERGLHCIDLPKLVPGAGHLVHMPAHIYIRVGRYLDAVKANEDAVLADDKYEAECHRQGVYELGYMPHNHHFLCAAAMLAGISSKSLESAHHLATHQDKKLMRDPGFGASLQHYWITPLYAMVRFGKWDGILKEPSPVADLRYPVGIWHYARGFALLRTGHPEQAEQELKELTSIAEDPKMKELRIWEINSTADVLQIAREVLSGEIAAQKKKYDQAVMHLQNAVKLEDALQYQEPADWNASARQNLGAILLMAGRPAEAEAVYRKDLQFVPENGWSLFGLAQSLRSQKKVAEAESVDQRFKKAWSQADIQITSSRM
jgi:tetratricopeptide (TPR) repeat protein